MYLYKNINKFVILAPFFIAKLHLKLFNEVDFL